MVRRLTWQLLTCAVALAASAADCGSDGDDLYEQALKEQRERGATIPAPSSRPAIKGRFDVGGRRLYMECRGAGLPTVVYLHGSVRVRNAGVHRNAAGVPARLDDRHRVCLYDRANVGRSDPVRGPLTGRDSAKDLHALLAAARVRGPYVLLGASLGGAIADLYAAAYPRDVAGMVLLDSTLPAYLAMYRRLYPPGSGPQPDDWRNEAEMLDRLATFRQAATIQDRRRRIPVTYIAAASYLPPRITATIRRAQRAFVERFSPGRLVVVDAPHSMEPVIPDRIAQEVERVIAAAERRPATATQRGPRPGRPPGL